MWIAALGFTLWMLQAPELYGQDQPGPVREATSIRLVERGALLMEDFNSESIDTKRWRIWKDNPDQVTVEQRGGRLDLTACGSVSHNGLAGLVFGKYKDVVLVGEMDIRSQGPSPHHLALHLCGSEPLRSPDHWTEVVMTDLGATARISTWTAGPEGPDYHQNQQALELPHPAGHSFLCRIELNGSTNMAELWVKAPDGWRPISDPVELALRTVHAEVKFNGNDRAHAVDQTATTSQAWFDGVRIYPRPKCHHVGILLVRSNGKPIWHTKNGAWPPFFTDASGKERKLKELQVELRTEDGTLVAAAQSENQGFYLLPLRDAPWDVYPVPAQVRVLLDGKVLGKPLQLKRPGDGVTQGLYPDDVYNVTIE
jgi:hypothetical protein